MLVYDMPLGLGFPLGGAEIGEAFGSVRAVPCQQNSYILGDRLCQWKRNACDATRCRFVC